MIKTFSDKETKSLWESGISKKIPSDIHKRALKKLRWLNASQTLSDLKIPPSNNLETLKGTRKGQYSIRINDKYRICFRWVDNNSYDVEIVDYH